MTDAELAIEVAGAGASIVRRRFGTDLDLKPKGPGDFATDVDVAAEAAMLAILRRERPADSILAEEHGRVGPVDSERTWLVDPLCGTLNYAARMRAVAVNVALRDGSGFRAAAVADPFGDAVYWTDMRTASMRARNQDSVLAPSARTGLVDLNLDPPFPNASRFRTAALAAHPQFSATFRPRVVSSTIAVAWVATGQRAAYVSDGDFRDNVHFAAGLALCEASGCVVTDLRGRPWGAGPGGLLIAADRECHAALLRLITECTS